MNKKISILGRILCSLVSIQSFGFGGVSSFVSKDHFDQGEVVDFFIEASGESIEFPTLSSIGGIPIVNETKTENMILSNGKNLKYLKVHYRLAPNSSFIIPPIEVKIDGIGDKTNPIEITKNENISQDGDDFQLIITTNKPKSYLGESVVVTFLFKHKIGVENLEYQPFEFGLSDFVIKELPHKKEYVENGYKVFSKEYLVSSKKSGKFLIPSQSTRITVRGKNYTIRKNIYSNEASLEVVPLPNGIDLFGEYAIDLEVSKREVEPNKPIYLTLTIEGFGNIDSLKEFHFDIPNSFLHSTKPTLETKIENGKYGGKFVQRFSLISESDLEIPIQSLQFFNPKKDTIETISTKPVEITIKEEEKEVSQIEVAKTPEIIVFQNTTTIEKIGYMLFGLVFGIVSLYSTRKLKSLLSQKTPRVLEDKIKKAKKEKELYHLLLPYAPIEALQPFVRLLEENLYRGGKNKIDREGISETLKVIKSRISLLFRESCLSYIMI